MHGAEQGCNKISRELRTGPRAKKEGWESEMCFPPNQVRLAFLRLDHENGMAVQHQHLLLSCPICRPFTYHHLENAGIGAQHVPKYPDARGGQRTHKRWNAGQEGMVRRPVKGGPHHGVSKLQTVCNTHNSPDLMMNYIGMFVSQPLSRAAHETLPCSTALIARQMQIETTVGCRFSSIRMAKIKMILILLSWQKYRE